MIGVLYSQKIYPGSERTILTSDGFHQYVILQLDFGIYFMEMGASFTPLQVV